MKNEELIKILSELPKEAEVLHLWDGSPRTSIEIVYLSKSGNIITSDYGQYVSDNEHTPVGSDDLNDNEYFQITEK